MTLKFLLLEDRIVFDATLIAVINDVANHNISDPHAAIDTLPNLHTIYVNLSLTTGANDGTSWADAFHGSNAMQQALNDAQNSSQTDQILVAGNLTYNGNLSYTGNTADPAHDGVAIFGGFNPNGDGTRNVTSYATTLTAPSGASILSINTGTVILDGFTLNGGNASGDGGAIRSFSSNLLIFHDNFIGNHAANGGAIYVSNGSTVNISDSAFINNSAIGGGGAIYKSGVALSNINDTNFTGNTASYGGSIAFFFSGALTLNHDTFNNNNASSGDGGAVNLFGDTSLSVSDSVFSNNYANNSSGGAIHSRAVSLTSVSNSNFNNNTADVQGGAIKTDNNGTVNITSSIFEQNHTQFDGGGAIYESGVALSNINDTHFTGNTAVYGGSIAFFFSGALTLNKDTFDNNFASNGDGGAVNLFVDTSLSVSDSAFSNNYAQNSSGGAIHSRAVSSTSVSNSNFNDNRADVQGGAIKTDNNGTVNITSSIFEKNYTQFGGGGALFSTASNLSVSGSTMSGNTALNGNGGAINSTSDLAVTINNNNFWGGITLSELFAGGNRAINGGAVATSNENGPINYSGNTFIYNVASSQGGAIWDSAETIIAPLSISGSTFLYNSAQDGGAIYTGGANVVTLTNLTANGNFADTGGVLYINGGNAVTVSGGLFTDNAATQYGGVIYGANYQSLNVTGGQYSGNSAAAGGNDGAAIYALFNANVLVDSTNTFTNNSPTGVGGPGLNGPVLPVVTIITPGATLRGIIIDVTNHPSADNSLLVSEVSALYATQIIYVKQLNNSGLNSGTSWQNAFLTLDSAIAYINTHPSSAVYQIWVAKGTYSGTTTFNIPDGVVLYGGFNGDETSPTQRTSSNVTTLNFGKNVNNIININSANVVIDDFNMTGSRLLDLKGAAVNVQNSSYVLFSGINFYNLNSIGNGSAINSSNSYLTVLGSSFSGNQVFGLSSHGGAIYVNGGSTVTISYNSFNCNSAVIGSGGAVYAKNVTLLNMSNDIFSGNISALGNGGALYATGNGTVNLSNDTFSNNIALKGAGGAVYVVNDGAVNIIGSTFTTNKSFSGSGGAIYASGNAAMTLTGDTFTSNKALNGSGGALNAINNNGVLTVNTSSFTGNQSTCGAGGAINVQGKYGVSISGSTFISNLAKTNGGAVSTVITGTATVSITGSTFTTNLAQKGGAIYDASSDKVTLVIGGSTQALKNCFTSSASSKGAVVWLGDGEAYLNGVPNAKNDSAWIAALINSNKNLISNQIHIS